MKTLIKLILVCFGISLIGCGAISTKQVVKPSNNNILEFMILHTNDHHGRPFLHQRDDYEVAGIAERAYIIRKLTNDIENFLLLDAGDINSGAFESRIFDAEPDIIGYNQIGYDAVVIGNNELFSSLCRLQRQIQWANFSFLSANVFTLDDEFVGVPYIIKTMPNGLNIAIFGLTISHNNVRRDYTLKCYVETAKELVPQLRRKADVVIALTHIGTNPDIEALDRGTNRLANEVPDIDIIVDGHWHSILQEPVVINGVPIIQSGYHGQYMGKAILQFCIKSRKTSLIEWENISLKRFDTDSPWGVDRNVFNALEEFKNRANEERNRIIGNNDFISQPNSLNTIVCDAFLFSGKSKNADIAFTYNPYLLGDLPSGTVSVFDAYNLFLYDIPLYLIELPGSFTSRMINWSMQQMLSEEMWYLKLSSNVKIEQVNDNDLKILINGEEINPEQLYRIVSDTWTIGGLRYQGSIVDLKVRQPEAILNYFDSKTNRE